MLQLPWRTNSSPVNQISFGRMPFKVLLFLDVASDATVCVMVYDIVGSRPFWNG